jgi:sec-independent protein translocase protein TatA
MNFGWQELLIILAIVFIIFGINKLPQLGKGLGEGIKNFKSAIKSINEEPEEKPKTETEENKKSA